MRLRWRAVRAEKRSTSDGSGVPAALPCFPYCLQNVLYSQGLSCSLHVTSCAFVRLNDCEQFNSPFENPRFSRRNFSLFMNLKAKHQCQATIALHNSGLPLVGDFHLRFLWISIL